jgi:hypothetical protein
MGADAVTAFSFAICDFRFLRGFGAILASKDMGGAWPS